MNILDLTHAAELSSLNDTLMTYVGVGQFADTWGSGFSEEHERTKARRDYLALLQRWYLARVEAILDLVGDRAIVLKGDKRFDLHNETEVRSARELAEEILAGLIRSQTLDSVLPGWVHQLVNRGLLAADQATGLDLAAPADTVAIERRQKAEQEEQTYKAGFKRLQAACIAYGRQQKNDWASRDFLDTYNRKPGRKHTEAGLLEFAKELGAKRLLPIGDRLATDLADLWHRLKGLVA